MKASKGILSIIAAAMTLSLFQTAWAAEGDTSESSGETKLKIEDVKGKVNPNDKVDQVITNRKLRAETGSKSKLSISTEVNYQGSTIEKPLAADRPNITAGANVPATAALLGSIAGKLRLGEMDYLKAGVGARFDQPLQQTEDGQKDIYDPYLTYGRLYRALGAQNVFTATSTFYTKESSRDIGYIADVTVSNTFIKDIGTSGLSLGLYTAAWHAFFDAEDKAVRSSGGTLLGQASDFQADYGLGIYPFVEYVLNDTFNLRTISGVWVYEHARGENGFKFSKNTIYQSFGVGISVTRDIFLYPNIQIIPEDIRADRTNVALSANVNVF